MTNGKIGGRPSDYWFNENRENDELNGDLRVDGHPEGHSKRSSMGTLTC